MRGILGSDKDEFDPSPSTAWTDGWPTLVELGIPALCVPEELGGFGQRADAAVIAAQELGAALHASPFAGITTSAHALARSGNDSALALTNDIVTGTRTCAFGYLASNGTSSHGIDGASDADALLLLDRHSNALLLFTEPSTWTVVAAPHRFDITRACDDVTVDVSQAQRLGPAPSAVALHGLLLAADALAGVERMVERTVEYAGQRQAFGRPIGGYQAVQHRLVDHTVRARGMKLLVGEAARLIVADSDEAARHVAMAQVSVSSCAVHILHDLLQLTGGIGFTWEYGLHLYERRAHQDARLSRSPRAAVSALAQIEGWTDAG